MPNKPAILYHYWNDHPIQVWEDWQNPVIVSIASLRAHDPEIPIYVLDVSNGERNWHDYPHKLNFKCIRTASKIPLLKTYQVYETTYRICSRQFDIDWLASRIPEDVIVSVESDIFFQDKFEAPEEVDRFHFNFYNSGFYFYNKKAALAQQFVALLRHYVLLGMSNPKVRAEIMTKYDWQYFQDEACMVYIVKSFGGMVAPLDEKHNVLFNPFKSYESEYRDAKSLHFIQAMAPKNRGLLPLLVREFYDIISKALTPVQLYDIYGPGYEPLAGKYTADDAKHMNLSYIKKRQDLRIEGMSKLMG